MHLIKKAIIDAGMADQESCLEDALILDIISNYPKESGVRNLSALYENYVPRQRACMCKKIK